MKTNYINQLQRDMFLMGNDNDTPIVEDVSMEDAFKEWINKHNEGRFNKTQWHLFKDSWQQREQQLLPIIKELGQVLSKAKECVSELTTLADGYENDFVEIQTTLDKYKNYL